MAQTTSGDAREVIASTIRAELARRRITGKDFAAAVRIPERTFRRRLSGTTAFTASEIAAIATHLGVPVTDLLPRSEAA